MDGSSDGPSSAVTKLKVTLLFVLVGHKGRKSARPSSSRVSHSRHRRLRQAGPARCPPPSDNSDGNAPARWEAANKYVRQPRTRSTTLPLAVRFSSEATAAAASSSG
ncbi:hypothetical protein MINTMi198_39860 [Mycobacterium intracellulare M.i.198]|uniref:Uncharacterized protein n=1 Tax=Mycobacterium paraintracellulare TaxID=1138383 RepID=A0ABN6AK39_9MYCO|nr:hypothetical protein MPRI_06080 [Mycobacterium paraintracellulare]BCP06631.1 hypothetical protein MINTM019_40870 [Mycobacterium paraintracellulare]BCP11713.1 hypothetical protein MINTM020_38110 [Mycobacterium paraintracellulare]BCP38616.1 hypothetical protein MINTMi198_39860 [Mycobacterium intracellulare M.i.198]